MKTIYTFLVTALCALTAQAAVTVTPLTESQFNDNAGNNLVWVAGGQIGLPVEKELGLIATTNYSSFEYTTEFYDSTHTGWDISSIVTHDGDFIPNPVISTTPFSVIYDGLGNITFSVGPTVGQTSYDVDMTISVAGGFNGLNIAVFSEGVYVDTHIRLRDMAFEGQSLATLNAYGSPEFLGSRLFDGMELRGVSDSQPWSLVGTVEFDFEDGGAFPEDDDFEFRVAGVNTLPVPEPSSFALFGIGGVLLLFRRKR